jgi:hypothetical protein
MCHGMKRDFYKLLGSIDFGIEVGLCPDPMWQSTHAT